MQMGKHIFDGAKADMEKRGNEVSVRAPGLCITHFPHQA
jgi:hypothetical protein